MDTKTARINSRDYTNSELMAVRAARELNDGDVVFVGIGLPNLACNLARATHAPNLVLIYESGAVGAVPERLPVSIGDPALVADSLAVASMPEVFQYYLQGGRIAVGFLGGAQIDRYANINSTVIGPYDHPKVRLPGSGGACEIAIHAERVIVVAPLSPRSFPSVVDFITSPGMANKYGTRQGLGLPGKGPVRIVTDVGILEPSPRDGELELCEVYPGVEPTAVKEKVGWPLRVRADLQTLPPPTPEELRLLRDVLDPEHLYLKPATA